MFKEECSNCVLGQNISKSLYNLLLDSDDHVIKIHVVERNCVLEILYINIKIWTGIVSWIILYITSPENMFINLSIMIK
jgi:hypothetical protein